MIVKISRFLLLLIIISVCAHYLPDLFWTKFEKSVNSPFISYSPILKDFIIPVVSGSELSRDARYKDTKGNIYDRDGSDTLLPFMNYRQVVALNKMPDSIDGVKITLDSVRLNNFNFMLRPSTIDFKEIPLYSLMESASGRIKLEMPLDFFRITNRMEFIDSKTNIIDEKKSELFTAALKNKGFAFPAKRIAGNPTTRKAFDEGYFVVDANDNLFHIKMVKGKPFCVNTNIPKGIKIVSLTVMENVRREFYSYLVTEDSKAYLMLYDKYKLQELPVKNYNYKTDALLVIGDYFYRTISVKRDNNVECFVSDRKYNLVAHHMEKWEGKDESSAGVAAAYLFPFTINFEDEHNAFMSLYVKYSDTRAFIFMLLSVIGAGVLIKYRKESVSNSVVDLLIVLFTGIYGLIAILAVKNVE
jgi:hypothetical protein